MADRLLEQLDQLQRGAREMNPRGRGYDTHNSYSRYDAYEPEPADYGMEEVYGDENTFPAGMNPESAMPYRDHYGGRPSHASQMPPPRWAARQPRPQVPAPRGPSTQPLDLSRSQYNDAMGATASSSPYEETLPSSPVVNAGRRRSAVIDQTYRRQPVQPTYRSQPIHSQPSIASALNVTEEGDDEYGESLVPSNISQLLVPAKRTQEHQGSRGNTPVVQGITLVSTHQLPDRFRTIFPFPLFNAVQSKCFQMIYNSNDNFVLSSPTGSGKTAVLELAICRLMNGFANGSYKVIYQAPTKSLCAERQRDWQQKFGRFDLQVAELTGDTDNAQLRSVAHASIIITTPEKWDSITRKWKDHQKLMQMVKLFLIDEVHILKEDRGATLEAIVSRMKSVGGDIRFVALSATVPNSQDIATWLGKDSVTPYLPAPRERFGEEFRPVPLSKHVCGYQSSGNDFAFEKTLNAKLPEVIARWSQRKPIMVFCFTRNSCVDTAKLLANWWASKGPRDRYWESPRKRVAVEDKDLRDTVSSGVAFHHAGLSANDRTAIEKAYLEGDVNVICCTSTLAVGINLPCHMVIIKNTVAYQNNGGAGGCKEYSDLEVMQMLGRAGRPQFDRSAVAVILTRLQKQSHYEKMVTGQEVLESCLHSNLIDHVNAEIGLGTITNAASAKRWLSGTFLYVRLKENPEHYKIEGDASGRTLEERLEMICNRVISLLQENDLVHRTSRLQCTEFGDAMARYYLQFESMKILLALPNQAKTSEILSALAQAAEFGDVRFRSGEKAIYKALNQDSSIKFPIPVNLDAAAHKISLIIQSVLGAVEFPSEDHKQRMDYATAKSLIFNNIQRLIRCVVDCQLHLQDSVTARNALALARSLGAQVWDDSPLHMKQLDGIGPVFVCKLVAAGLKTVDDIENTEQHRLEQILSRNPPLGAQLQERARAFPKLRLGMKMVGDPVTRAGECVTVRVRANIGFMNDKTPEFFKKQPIYVCLMAELSDGHLLHFARISAKKLNKGQEVMFEARLTHAGQTIRAYVMCDLVAGTMRNAILQPNTPAHMFATIKATDDNKDPPNEVASTKATSGPRTGSKRRTSATGFDEFDDAGIDDADLALAANDGFQNIEDFEDEPISNNNNNSNARKRQKTTGSTNSGTSAREPRQLENGKWACNHNCKDKNSCKHLCCREGLDKKPKPSKSSSNKKDAQKSPNPKQTQLSLAVSKTSNTPAATQASQPQKSVPAPKRGPPSGPEMRKLDTLHNNVKSNTQYVPLLSTAPTRPATNDPNPPVTLPRSGQSRSKASEAARIAAQSIYSDDFGGDEDLSVFSEHAADGPTKRLNPPLESENDLFENDLGDMVDSFPPTRNEESHDQTADGGQDDHAPDPSLFDFDEDFMLAAGETSFETSQSNHFNLQRDAAESAGPFVETSDSSAALDLGLGYKDGDQTLSSTTAIGSIENTYPGPEDDAAHGSTIQGGLPDERPTSSDSATKLFMEELGADLFNYIG